MKFNKNLFLLLLIFFCGASFSAKANLAFSPLPSFSTSVTPNGCPSETNGQITISIDGATSFTPEYSIDGGITWYSTDVFSNLSSGQYHVKYRNPATGETSEIESVDVAWTDMTASLAHLNTFEPNLADGSIGVVDMYGDYAIMIADNFDNGRYGQIYVAYRDEGGPGNWGIIDIIDNPDVFPSSHIFGSSASIYGDYIVVGTWNYSNNKKEDVYVFKKGIKRPNEWDLLKRLSASNGDKSDEFGSRVHMEGEYIYVGARGADVGGRDAGALYIYKKDEGGIDNWGEVEILRSPTPNPTADFGAAIDSDGETLIISAPFDDLALSQAGAIYVYQKDENGADDWNHIKTLTASDADWALIMGRSIAIEDGFIFASAPRRNDDKGGVYVFAKDEGGIDNWGEVTILTASDESPNSDFGGRVQLTDDKLYVSSGRYNPDSETYGAVYLFEKNFGGTNNWGEKTIYVSPETQQYESFGGPVAYGDDVAMGIFSYYGSSKILFYQNLCCSVDAGDLSAPNDASFVKVCPEVNLHETIEVDYSAVDETSPNFPLAYAKAYLLTDGNGDILYYGTEGKLDMNNIPSGFYDLYHLSYFKSFDELPVDEYLAAIIEDATSNDIAQIQADVNAGSMCIDLNGLNANGEQMEVFIQQAPTASLTSEAITELCQANSILLTAQLENDPFPEETTYQWEDYSTEAQFATDLYKNHVVTITDYNGCSVEGSIDLSTLDLSDYQNNYTILSENGMFLSGSTISEGGIGAIADLGEINLVENSMIVANETFAKANIVNVKSNSQAGTVIQEAIDFDLPAFVENPYNNNADVVIANNAVQILTGDNYGHITVGENSKLIFSGQEEVFINGLKVEKGASIEFSQCTQLINNDQIVMDENTRLNSGEMGVSIYSEGLVMFYNANQIAANIYTLNDLRVQNDDPVSTTNMKGLFIAQYVMAIGNVTWSQLTSCENCDGSGGGQNMSGNSNFDFSTNEALNNSNDWKVFPNPAQQFVNIQLETETQSAGLLIISDVMGRKVYEQIVEIGQVNIEIELLNNRFKNGTYLIYFTNKEQQLSQQLTVLR